MLRISAMDHFWVNADVRTVVHEQIAKANLGPTWAYAWKSK